MEKILCTNRGDLAGYKIIEDLGLIGSAVAPSKFIIKDIMASIRQIFGTEMKEYTQMIDQARRTVLKRMIIQASELEADAIVNIRFMATGVSTMSAEMMGYGTAVKIKKLEDS